MAGGARGVIYLVEVLERSSTIATSSRQNMLWAMGARAHGQEWADSGLLSYAGVVSAAYRLQDAGTKDEIRRPARLPSSHIIAPTLNDIHRHTGILECSF
eukprot:scaffold10682_cov94-Skeletonema_dohrnii-CCMP3373.AAC.1